MAYQISVWFLDALNMNQLGTICKNMGLGDMIAFEECNRYLVICAIIDMTKAMVTVDMIHRDLYMATFKSRIAYGSTPDLAVFDALFLTEN